MVKPQCGDLYKMLQDIRIRPGMWLRSRSLEVLETLLDGYSHALYAHSIEEFGTDFGKRFREYLWENHRWHSPYGWAEIISEHCSGPEAAWDRFCALVDDFRERAA